MKRRREKITLTPSLLQKIDDYKEPDFADNYKPSKECVLDFVEMVGEDVFYAEIEDKEKKSGSKKLILLIGVFVVLLIIGIIIFLRGF